MPDLMPNPRKRKATSDGDIDRINLARRLRNHRNTPIPGTDYGPRQHEFESIPRTAGISLEAVRSQSSGPVSRLSSESYCQTSCNSIPSSRWTSSMSASSSDNLPIVGAGPPQGPSILPNAKSVLSSCLSIDEWLEDADSLNSVRWPDSLDFCDKVPNNLYEIPGFLFRPRPPPVLPLHILNYSFEKVLRRYNRLSKLIDNYQRWHGRDVFAFWTKDEIKRVDKAPSLVEEYAGGRPSIPRRILATRFDIVLLAAPLLSHLIERYHNDLGYDYFAFYAQDPRNDRTRRESESSNMSGSDSWDVFAGLEKLLAYKN
ncbi:hypothetical protein F4803DRAFT_551186 [Xylaria telfairii]|nr:hypothetical protein F4803DRAFT_551186 [Xylaria telfairii]